MASLSPPPKLQFFGTDGLPLVGGKLYTYAAGTTTPLATYTDHTQTSQNTNPIILDSAGQAGVWLTDSTTYKYTLTDADNVPLFTVDYVSVPVTTCAFSPARNRSQFGVLMGRARCGASLATASAKKDLDLI